MNKSYICKSCKYKFFSDHWGSCPSCGSSNVRHTIRGVDDQANMGDDSPEIGTDWDSLTDNDDFFINDDWLLDD